MIEKEERERGGVIASEREGAEKIKNRELSRAFKGIQNNPKIECMLTIQVILMMVIIIPFVISAPYVTTKYFVDMVGRDFEGFEYLVPISYTINTVPAFILAFFIKRKSLRKLKRKPINPLLWYLASIIAAFLWIYLVYRSFVNLFIQLVSIVYIYNLTRVFLASKMPIIRMKYYFYFVTNYFIFNTIFYFLLIKFFM